MLVFLLWGFIAAVRGKMLEIEIAMLQQSSNVGNISLSNGVESDILAVKTYQNGSITRAAYRQRIAVLSVTYWSCFIIENLREVVCTVKWNFGRFSIKDEPGSRSF